MIDKLYYGAVLSALTGLIIWAIKNYVGTAITNMAVEVGHVRDGVTEVKDEVKSNMIGARKEIKGATLELKEHFDKTCVERQTACQQMTDNRITRLENHGHTGLKGDDAKITG